MIDFDIFNIETIVRPPNVGIQILDLSGKLIAIGLIEREGYEKLLLLADILKNDRDFLHFNIGTDDFLTYFEETLGMELLRK